MTFSTFFYISWVDVWSDLLQSGHFIPEMNIWSSVELFKLILDSSYFGPVSDDPPALGNVYGCTAQSERSGKVLYNQPGHPIGWHSWWAALSLLLAGLLLNHPWLWQNNATTLALELLRNLFWFFFCMAAGWMEKSEQPMSRFHTSVFSPYFSAPIHPFVGNQVIREHSLLLQK